MIYTHTYTNTITYTNNNRRFLRKSYFLIKLFQIRRKEVVKENNFWNNADTAFYRHVNVCI